MRQYQVYDTPSQKEALINEFKGNLFEYLVASTLARDLGLEAQFMRSLDNSLAERLRHYEDWLWQHESALALRLPELAIATVRALKPRLPQVKFRNIVVMGKLAGGSHDESFGEADILLIDSEDHVTPISLKLCRRGAYVNTKSGGIRSFLSKYFSSVPNIDVAQARVNVVLNESYASFARQLHENHKLNAMDRFGQAWEEAKLPQLPGQLNITDQALLQSHYARMISVLYQGLAGELERERTGLEEALLTLLGFNIANLLQVTCFHTGLGDERYQLDSVKVVSESERRMQLKDLTISAPVDEQASFSFQLGPSTLQIRVKPMNKFTQPALKVNCSVRSND